LGVDGPGSCITELETFLSFVGIFLVNISSLLSSFFTVWQKLEEENPEFFKAYYLRLMLKNQITAFNKLLEDQFQLMNKDYSSGIPSMPLTNGSNSTPGKTFFPALERLFVFIWCDNAI
jgi:hypothetical protein